MLKLIVDSQFVAIGLRRMKSILGSEGIQLKYCSYLWYLNNFGTWNI